MSKRNHLILLMVVVATVVLFAATQVAQAADCALNTSVTSDRNTYTLTIDPGGPDNTFPYPEVIDGETWYRYDHTLDNTDLDHVYVSIPYNCNDPIRINEDIIGGTHFLAPGTGAGGVGHGDYSVRILDIPPTTNRVTYYADRDTLGPISVFFPKGKVTLLGQNSVAGVGYQVEEVLATNFEYDDLITICVKKEQDKEMRVTNLWYSCFEPANDETCPETISSWTSINKQELREFYNGGMNFNAKTPGTVNIKSKEDIFDLCPRVEELSFMDFLAPSVAHAQIPGCKITYRSGSNYWCLLW